MSTRPDAQESRNPGTHLSTTSHSLAPAVSSMPESNESPEGDSRVSYPDLSRRRDEVRSSPNTSVGDACIYCPNDDCTSLTPCCDAFGECELRYVATKAKKSVNSNDKEKSKSSPALPDDPKRHEDCSEKLLHRLCDVLCGFQRIKLPSVQSSSRDKSVGHVPGSDVEDEEDGDPFPETLSTKTVQSMVQRINIGIEKITKQLLQGWYPANSTDRRFYEFLHENFLETSEKQGSGLEGMCEALEIFPDLALASSFVGADQEIIASLIWRAIISVVFTDDLADLLQDELDFMKFVRKSMQWDQRDSTTIREWTFQAVRAIALSNEFEARQEKRLEDLSQALARQFRFLLHRWNPKKKCSILPFAEMLKTECLEPAFQLHFRGIISRSSVRLELNAFLEYDFYQNIVASSHFYDNVDDMLCLDACAQWTPWSRPQRDRHEASHPLVKKKLFNICAMCPKVSIERYDPMTGRTESEVACPQVHVIGWDVKNLGGENYYKQVAPNLMQLALDWRENQLRRCKDRRRARRYLGRGRRYV
ncbi:uncharacterized protein F5Z01DRAFT_632084 [Emericellopsis atlantica]|uniref:Uncharacterized protein n=1 Tax=Emericellopsis atlantica TaxID=2614577 RepID=A0A9P7ZVI6_9HYPO|nr:uncharacterized protein F5Z01DRAFT_632084 [Emericellopsis atlantica]KAG9259000.1 hypothetical protein F5Z01DRAFT_632084 [Emericellopsis atlantica]